MKIQTPKAKIWQQKFDPKETYYAARPLKIGVETIGPGEPVPVGYFTARRLRQLYGARQIFYLPESDKQRLGIENEKIENPETSTAGEKVVIQGFEFERAAPGEYTLSESVKGWNYIEYKGENALGKKVRTKEAEEIFDALQAALQLGPSSLVG